MKISYTWLKDFIDIDWTPEQTGELLTDLGLEVEGIEEFESVKGGLEGIVTGKVLTCKKHPNADKLKLTTVDIGSGSSLQVVCGAPNVAKGQVVPVATVGTVLHDKEKGPWTIKKGEIRGEESFGMICSEDELGLSKDADGIMVLPEETEIGLPMSQVVNVLKDHIFEIGLTPNRSDAMSHYGVARDLRAGLKRKEINKPLNIPPVSKFKVDNHTRHIPVLVEDSVRAPRYCGVTITGVTVKDSPLWLQNRLKAIGLSPINNIVDATNYVMHSLGQPFHAFDADKIEGQKIIVKTLPAGTKFVTLDGVERELHEEDLMICDEKKPLCIGGVYGGLTSGVSDSTKNVFLESAYFDPVSIRKSAKRHGLNTDASFRFERGIDPDLTDYALKRLSLLILEIAGGKVSSDINDFYPKKIQPFEVFLRYDKINKLIGQTIDQNDLKSILSSLNIAVKNTTESGMGLAIPPFRTDVQREVDVVEEILRVYGYNEIEAGDKINASIALSSKYDDHNIQNLVGNQLNGQGFNEIMSNSLTDAKYNYTEKDVSEEKVSLLNPLSKELAVMRSSMLSGGMESIAHNLNRQIENIKFFEFGKTYHLEGGKHKEYKHLAIFTSGMQNGESWNSISRQSGFFYMKGVLEGIFSRLGLVISLQSAQSEVLSEGLEIVLNNKKAGYFGVIKKSILKTFDVDQEVIYADLNWEYILSCLGKTGAVHVQDLPKYPSVRRDFALLVDSNIQFAQIEKIAFEVERKILKKVGLFDVYEGKNLPENKKSYAVSFTFLDESKTLTDKRIDKIMEKLRSRFEGELGAMLR